MSSFSVAIAKLLFALVYFPTPSFGEVLLPSSLHSLLCNYRARETRHIAPGAITPIDSTTGPIEIQHACLPIGDPARMARPPLLWDPSDTRGVDPDPSCLPHALALAYPLLLLISQYSSTVRSARCGVALLHSPPRHDARACVRYVEPQRTSVKCAMKARTQ